MNILDLILSKFNKPQFLGVVDDPRPAEQKEKEDVKFEEIVASADVPLWFEKKESEWRKFPDLNQKRSSMCGAFSGKKELGVFYFTKYNKYPDFSEADIYQRRSNRPEPGMSVEDIYKIFSEGVTLKDLTLENINTDTDADTLKVDPIAREVGKAFATGGGKIIIPNDIDIIASTIRKTGKAIRLLTFFTEAEWSQFIPQVIDRNLYYESRNALRHYVMAVDTFLYKGQKVVLIEDSAWFGGYNRRLVTAEWLAKRVLLSTYLMRFKFEPESTRPIYFFVDDNMRFGQSSNDIKALQDILKYEGMFPTNVASSGYYGSVTASGVIQFQKKYKVDSDAIIDSLGGKSVGPQTRAKLNQLYSS